MDTPVNIERHRGCAKYSGQAGIPFCTTLLRSGEEITLHSEERMMLLFVDSRDSSFEVGSEEKAPQHRSEPYILFLGNHNSVTVRVGQKSRVSCLRFYRPTQLCASFSIYQLKPHAPESMEVITLGILEPMAQVIDSAVRYYEDELMCCDLFDYKLKEVLFVLAAYYKPEDIGRLLAPLLMREVSFKEFVFQHYTQVEKVQELAEMRGMSLRAFNEEFKATFGQPPYAWMLQQKAGMIETRLLQEVPFAKIIEEFGFSSPSHFTVFCKKHYGMTPTKKKRELLKARKLERQEEARRELARNQK